MGERAAAESAYQATIEIDGKLVREMPDDLELERLLAIRRGAMGLSNSESDRQADALSDHRKALAIRREIARKRPDDPLAAEELARTLRDICRVLELQGKPAEALESFDKCLRNARPLLDRPLPPAAEKAELTGRRDPLAMVRDDRGTDSLDQAHLPLDLFRLPQSVESWALARDLFEKLVEAAPNDLTLRARLVDCHETGFMIAMRNGQPGKAHRRPLRGIEICRELAGLNPSVAVYRRSLAEHAMRLSVVLEELQRMPEGMVAIRRAVETLGRAIAAGYGSFQKRLSEDEDLKLLLDRDEFRKLDAPWRT